MINNAKILEMLREATLSEEKPVGLAQTDKIKGQSKGSNKDYYKDVEKKMSAYEKASTTSAKDSIEEPKFNYEGDSEKEYHDDMEIRNGMEMLNYDRKPSEMFTQRAKEAIEGSSNMGNNPEWANVFPAQKGFTGPDFGKNLVKTIERSKKKRDAATPTLDQFGDDIEEKNVGVNKTKSAYKPAVTKKPVAIGESVIKEGDKKTFTIKYWLYLKDDEKEEFQAKIEAETAEEAMEKFRQTERGKSARKPRIVENVPPRPKVKQEPNPTEPRQTMKRPIVRQQDNPTEPQKTMKRPIVRQQDNPVSEAQTELESIKGRAKSESKDCGCAQHVNKTAKGGYVIEDFFDSDKTVASYENGRTLNENYNKTTNESKMKRIKFKKPFNGVETALNVIPESYKVDNKVFEMTDGAEHYRVRWEGNLTEGKGVVLSSFHQEALNEDVSKIMHLMGFKSQDTLGTLKGSQRLTEDSVFFDMLKKSKESLNEAEAKPDFLDVDKDGDKKEPMKKAAKEANHEKSIEEAEMVDEGFEEGEE